MVIKMENYENDKLKEIQDLVMMIDEEAEILRFEARNILNFYNIWVKGDDLKALIKAINSTLKNAKNFERDLKKLKNLLKGKV